MMKAGTLFLLFCLTCLMAHAQHYSGYYMSAPQLADFHHFKIHQKEHGSHLLVKGIIDKTELWEVPAHVLPRDSAQAIIAQFSDGKTIDHVYELDIAYDGASWRFYLLSYHDHERNHGAFKVIEEVFEDEETLKPSHIMSFEWYKSHLIHHQPAHSN